MTTTDSTGTEPERPRTNPSRIYIIIAVLLVLVIVLVGAVLVTKGIPALRQPTPESTLEAETMPTLSPTFTPAPAETAAAPAPQTPTSAAPGAPVMAGVETPLFEVQSAGARPSADWTGFFGQVLDAQGQPLPGVPLIVWFADEQGTPASPVVETDVQGNYEIRLAEGAYAGSWTLQVLTPDLQPASMLQTFTTDENTETGVQQIQVIWQQVP